MQFIIEKGQNKINVLRICNFYTCEQQKLIQLYGFYD